MNRNKFIKSIGLATVGTSLIPFLSFSTNTEYSREQLIGKDNAAIVGSSYTSKMHRDTKTAFEKMRLAAAEEGIAIEVVSAFRSFQR
ncbi:MAG: D-alanyl-D-alanine carboxypeptidase family protein, partial [Flavobacteriaceae bacterium]|nr:D-alanyl-D-alanine carboxypeptidase family protein [Flavobacteriaceae bacterium]